MNDQSLQKDGGNSQEELRENETLRRRIGDGGDLKDKPVLERSEQDDIQATDDLIPIDKIKEPSQPYYAQSETNGQHYLQLQQTDQSSPSLALSDPLNHQVQQQQPHHLNHPRPRTPPHRKLPPREPLRGILKPPPPPQAKFNFKRDILNPFSSKLGYAALEESPLGAVVGAGGGPVGLGVQAAAGWVGSAWKKLGAVAVIEKAKIDEHLRTQLAIPALSPPQPNSTTTTLLNISSDQHHSESSHQNIRTNTVTPISTDLQPRSPLPLPSLVTLAETSPDRAKTAVQLPPSRIGSYPPPNSLSISSLKKVHFTMSDLKLVYPISNSEPPCYDQINKARINQARRLVLSNRHSQQPHSPSQRRDHRSKSSSTEAHNGWTASSLESLYDECCRTREEGWGILKIREILKLSAPNPPQSIDLQGIALNRLGSVELLGDLLSVDFGLKTLNLRGCSLEDDFLKPILHGLLVSGTLPTLNFANNRKLRAKGWKMIATFIKRAKALRTLDLSDNSLDRRSVEYLSRALTNPSCKDKSPHSLTSSPQTTLQPLISIIDQANSHSSPSLLSDTENECRGGQTQDLSSNSFEKKGRVDQVEDVYNFLFPPAPLLKEEHQSLAWQALTAISNYTSPSSSNLISLKMDNCNLKAPQLDALAHGVRLSNLKHISLRNNKISNLGLVALAVMIRDWPTDFSSSLTASYQERSKGRFDDVNGSNSLQRSFDSDGPTTPKLISKFESLNSVTARQSDLIFQQKLQNSPFTREGTQLSTPEPSTPTTTTGKSTPKEISDLIQEEIKRASEQRLRLRSKIDPLPKIGNLLTLDIKGNEIRSNELNFYLSQVLKKNRTLKVLNLSDNRIDHLGLAGLADCLRYNTCLETLDLSRNPCCGPNLEGVLALRTACTVNSSLKRIFLSRTDLSSQGAIAIAEFLPEMNNLIHLDLTENFEIDIAGVMALAVSVKMNTSLRCLDINIPPNDPDFSRLSQDILQSCVRNTEFARQAADQRGNQTNISQPMLKSTVAKALANQTSQQTNENIIITPILTPTLSKKDVEPKKAPPYTSRRDTIKKILSSAVETCEVLTELIREDERRKMRMMRPKTDERRVKVVIGSNELVDELIDQARAALVQLAEANDGINDGDSLNDETKSVERKLTQVLEYSEVVYQNKSEGYLDNDRANELDSCSLSDNLKKEDSSSETEVFEDGKKNVTETSFETGLKHNNGLNSERGNVTNVSSDLKSQKDTVNEDDDEDDNDNDNDNDNKEEGCSSKGFSHSRSLTIEEGEVFRKGTVLGAAEVDDERTRELSGDSLKESVRFFYLLRNKHMFIYAEKKKRFPKLFFLMKNVN
ncbi:hypothetical protein BY996DRAFT_4583362 [Phakopsora pachyrhizi]|nr:hypothetical protein BY996DRAFT_4583362 [Phakopsora pachyrhizi]